jgi:exopolysaccharide biosynthesis polyprenyl glycosylphosphotransferase
MALMGTRKSFNYALNTILVAFDSFGIYFGYLLSFFIYQNFFGRPPEPFDEVLKLALIPMGFGVASFFLTSVYRCQPGPLGLDQLRRLLSAYFWSGMMAFSLTFFTKTQGFSRIMVSIGFLLGIIFVLLGRALFVRVTAPIRSNYNLNRRILILGAGQVGKTLARNLLSNVGHHEIIGFLDDQSLLIKEVIVKVGDKNLSVPVLGNLSEIEKVCRAHRITEVIVAMTKAAHALHQDLFSQVKDLELSFSIVPSALELVLRGAEAYSIGRIPLFRIGERKSFILTPYLKRLFDISWALFIGIMSSPIWVVSWILIKLDSPGPALFVHERIGKDGEKFKLFKFRSMKMDADPYAVTPMTPNDERITKLGKFIRRTSIDEIPQLINILKGEMSLVGPRPEMPFIVNSYDDLQRLRLSVKPGLTGVWQISADRANPIHENLDYDLYYLENQSFWLDLAILMKTFTSVVKGVGAY